jgi:hypothetical protein
MSGSLTSAEESPTIRFGSHGVGLIHAWDLAPFSVGAEGGLLYFRIKCTHNVITCQEKSLQRTDVVGTIRAMNQKKRATKDEYIEIRVLATEKEGFVMASDLAGVSLSSWIRERLRMAAIRELESAGRRIPFVPDIPLGGTNARS